MKIGTHYLNDYTLRLLQQATNYLYDQQAYLVGGSVRNLLLDKPCIDWDIVTTGDTPRLARRLANKLSGYYVHLHDKADRIIFKHDGQDIVFDIAPLHTGTIEGDLHERDFTINAIAIPLPNLIAHLITQEPLTLIDPLQGASDLEARRLKAVNDMVFRHDPLRMLRAVRFMTRYHLTLEEQTASMLTRDAALLPQVASERIHEELYAILQPEGATECLRLLDQHGLLTTLIPEFVPARGMRQPYLHYWDVFDHSLETVRGIEQLVDIFQQTSEEIRSSPLHMGKEDDLVTVQTLLHEAEQQGLGKLTDLAAPPMKMAALLHDIGKPVTYAIDDNGEIHFYHHPQVGVPLADAVMRRISASTHDRRLVQRVVAHHMRPGQLSCTPATPRAIRRYFVDLGSSGINVAIASLADHLAMRGPEPLTDAWEQHLATVRLLLTRYIRERERILPPRILHPEELMRRLNLEPGPLIGQLLEAIAEAQAEGEIHSKEDALWLAQEKLQETVLDDQ
jgi:poly(A) polymerase